MRLQTVALAIVVGLAVNTLAQDESGPPRRGVVPRWSEPQSDPDQPLGVNAAYLSALQRKVFSLVCIQFRAIPGRPPTTDELIQFTHMVSQWSDEYCATLVTGGKPLSDAVLAYELARRQDEQKRRDANARMIAAIAGSAEQKSRSEADLRSEATWRAEQKRKEAQAQVLAALASLMVLILIGGSVWYAVKKGLPSVIVRHLRKGLVHGVKFRDRVEHWWQGVKDEARK